MSCIALNYSRSYDSSCLDLSALIKILNSLAYASYIAYWLFWNNWFGVGGVSFSNGSPVEVTRLYTFGGF